jgi:hypothetical protein
VVSNAIILSWATVMETDCTTGVVVPGRLFGPSSWVNLTSFQDKA